MQYLTQLTKGTVKCSKWEFYLRDVYIHFMGEGGTDLALPRCKLKMATSHFIAPVDSFSEPSSSSVPGSNSSSSSSSQDIGSSATSRREKRRIRRENIPSVIFI